MGVIVMADELHSRETLAAALRASGFDVGTRDAGGPSNERVNGDADLVIVVGRDEHLIARALTSEAPVVALPARWTTDQQVRTATEMAGSVLGRGPNDIADDAIVVGDLVIEEDAHATYRAGVPVDLTHREFLLLTLLARHPNRVLNREALMEKLWGSDVVTPNTIEVHISSLRRKLEHFGPRLIFTVRRVGYVLRPDAGRRPMVRESDRGARPVDSPVNDTRPSEPWPNEPRSTGMTLGRPTDPIVLTDVDEPTPSTVGAGT